MVELRTVEYTGGWTIHEDSGSPYPAPQWQSTSSISFPYLYSAGQTVGVKAVWAILPESHIPPGVQVLVRGTGPEGIDFAAALATVNLATKQISFTAAAQPSTTQPFPFKTRYFDEFEILWEMSCDNGETWVDADANTSVIYVSFISPASARITPYRTVVHLACSKDGATTANAAVLNTFLCFSNYGLSVTDVKAWDEDTQSWSRPLYYYLHGTTAEQNAKGGAAALLQRSNGSGQCTTWASLMGDACCLNCPPEYLARVRAYSNVAGFMVKDWTISPTYYPFSFVSETPAPPPPPLDMVPEPPGGVYGDCTNKPTIQGQGTWPYAPSQKVFLFHEFIGFYGNNVWTYYDPAYGAIYGSEADFAQKVIAGFDVQDTTIAGKLAFWGRYPNDPNVSILPFQYAYPYNPNP